MTVDGPSIGRRSLGSALVGCALVLLLAAALLLSVGVESAVARKSCGTYNTTSTYERARVIAIRGVNCRKARRVAIAFDRRGRRVGSWQCGFARAGDGRRLFSCGRGGRRGDLRDFPHALEVRGVGRRN